MIDARHTDSTTALIKSMRMTGVIGQITKSISKTHKWMEHQTVYIYSKNQGRQIGGRMLLYTCQSIEVKANLMVSSGCGLCIASMEHASI